MLKRLVSSLVLIVALIASPSVLAKGSGRSSGHGKAKVSAPKTVHVKGHTTKDGTYVAPHDRSTPTTAKQSEPEKATAAETPKAPSVVTARDEHGSIKRSEQAKHAFMTQTGYPHGRPGYVVDHIIPLACGGIDAPSNMQWQTLEAAKAKDRVERVGCR